MNSGLYVSQKIPKVNLEIPNLFPQMYLEIQSNPNQNLSRLFIRGNSQVNCKTYIKIQTTKDSQGNPEEEQSPRALTTRYQDLL